MQIPKLTLENFDFDLPKELIAQMPPIKRDHSHLLVENNGNYEKVLFYNILNYLNPGDLLVFNNSKVIKAKLLLSKFEGSREIEIYLHKKLDNGNWQGFAKPARKLKEGDIFDISRHKIIITKKYNMGEIEVAFELDGLSLFEFLDKYGQIPLPPYIKRKSNYTNVKTLVDNAAEDEERYQTVFSQIEGSVAAPTASLHFTKALLNKIEKKNIQTAYITLHVGAGTFLPIRTNDLEQHKMHSEYYNINQEAADSINKAMRDKRRVIAVGTTVLRALESAYLYNNKIDSSNYETSIFIKPGFKFKVCDALITNFHLPKSTLLILACAFAGYDRVRAMYEYGIKEKMRFFSYGDAMLLLQR